MFILAIGVNRAWFSAQLCHSTLCLLLLMQVKLHQPTWNHYREQTETGWCSEWTAVISFQLSEIWTAEWCPFSDLYKVVITFMLTLKGPALLSLWICLIKSKGVMHVCPACISTLCLPTISVHLCSLIHFALPKTFNHLCWSFPCFISDQKWVWIFEKARGIFHLLLVNWNKCQNKETFPQIWEGFWPQLIREHTTNHST